MIKDRNIGLDLKIQCAVDRDGSSADMKAVYKSLTDRIISAGARSMTKAELDRILYRMDRLRRAIAQREWEDKRLEWRQQRARE